VASRYQVTPSSFVGSSGPQLARHNINRKEKEVWQDLRNDGLILFRNIRNSLNSPNTGKDDQAYTRTYEGVHSQVFRSTLIIYS
jgi:hypothetical protein